MLVSNTFLPIYNMAYCVYNIGKKTQKPKNFSELHVKSIASAFKRHAKRENQGWTSEYRCSVNAFYSTNFIFLLNSNPFSLATFAHQNGRTKVCFQFDLMKRLVDWMKNHSMFQTVKHKPKLHSPYFERATHATLVELILCNYFSRFFRNLLSNIVKLILHRLRPA